MTDQFSARELKVIARALDFAASESTLPDRRWMLAESTADLSAAPLRRLAARALKVADDAPESIAIARDFR